MPTGYTAAIADRDVSFEEFTWSCARSFGALILMRDDPMGAPVPEKFEPSSYHSTHLAKAGEALASLLAMSDEEATKTADEWHARRSAEVELSNRRRAQVREKYEAMMAKVQAWTPPTPDHTKLRDFMIEQLRTSIRHDSFVEHAPAKQTGLEYRENLIRTALRDVDYHAKERDEEISRTNERNAWVAALRESIGSQPEKTHAP